MANNTLNIVPYDSIENKTIQVQNDVEFARDNIKGVIETITPALIDLATIARQSQNDKYYAALSSLAKTVVDANKELITVSKTDKEIEKLSIENDAKRNEDEDNMTQINQLYVSSADVLDQIIEKLGKAKSRVEKKMKDTKKKESDNNGNI